MEFGEYSVHLDGPALGVGNLAPLDAGEGVIELLGQGADLALGNIGHIVLPLQFLDRRDHGSGAGAKDLLQLAVLGGSHDVGDGSLPSMTS